MSPSDYRSQRMNRQEARKLVGKIMSAEQHNVVVSGHARDELLKDNLTTGDAINILTSPDAKIHDEGEMEKGTYRYRLETDKICLVVAFESATKLIVVTGWRKRT